MSAVDLTDHLNQSSLFVWVYIPTASTLTSVNLRWGSDSANYYTVTVTTNQQGNAFVNGWNLCQFVWSAATVVGAPVVTAIDYVRVTMNITGNNTAMKVNGINSILGLILVYEYYSKYMFRDVTTGAFQETVTDDSNLINLDTDTYNLLTDLVAYYATQQQQGINAASYDGPFFKAEYDKNLARYKALYKSEISKPQSQYYFMPRKGWGRFLGRGW
jgi:hypothetical protein